jgi:hypothetical protein
MNCKSGTAIKNNSLGLRNLALAGQILLWAGLMVSVGGCKRQDIQVYTVPKETVRPEVTANSGGGEASGEAKPGLTWKTPEGWEEVPPGEMRVASFRVKGENGKQADVSAVPLPGMAGGDIGNVNRWRGQLGLSPVAEGDLPKIAEAVEVAGQSGQLFDQAGKAAGSDDPTRMLAVIYRKEGTAWFFKMTGDDELVAKQKPTFIAFLKTLNFEGKASQTELPPSHPPIDSGSIASSRAPAAQASSAGKPNWQVPSGWQEVDAGQFLVAKFKLVGEGNAQAAVNVSMSAGDGGGLEANVNRWRGQLGLPAMASTELSSAVQTLDIPGGKAMLIEMNGTDARTGQASRLVGAMVPKGTQTWFYKLMGDQAVVDREKKTFTHFLETAKY